MEHGKLYLGKMVKGHVDWQVRENPFWVEKAEGYCQVKNPYWEGISRKVMLVEEGLYWMEEWNGHVGEGTGQMPHLGEESRGRDGAGWKGVTKLRGREWSDYVEGREEDNIRWWVRFILEGESFSRGWSGRSVVMGGVVMGGVVKEEVRG